MRTCLKCDEEIIGRSDKVFCCSYCKSAFHYEENKKKRGLTFERIDRQLKLNRKLLKQYNKAGKATVRKSVLMNAGFNPNLITHWWKNSKGEVYFFCYEYGFLLKRENNKEKFVLIQWQSFMGKK